MRIRVGRPWMRRSVTGRSPLPTVGRPLSPHLVALLRAADGPPRIAERVGEDAAVDAYRAARIAARGRPADRPAAQPWARAGVWIAAVVVTGTAGAAVAAGVHAPDRAPWSRAGAGHAPVTSQRPAETPDAAPRPSRSAGPSRSAVPTDSGRPDLAAVTGLCTAYLGSNGRPEKAMSNLAWRDLVTTAGGVDRVAAYCRDLVPSGKPEPPRSNPRGERPPNPAPSHRPSVPA
jgi:hypothetical protein